MPRSYWIAAIALGLVVVCSTGWLVFHTVRSDANYRVQADQAAGYYADYASHQINVSCHIPVFPFWDYVCVEEANNASQENQRAEYDLYAQNVMALWTRVMGWMSVVAVALTAIGIWFVKRTLDATNSAAVASAKATDIMQKSYLADNRPRVSVQWESGKVSQSTGDVLMHLHRLSKNMGRQPAERVRINTYFLWKASEVERQEIVAEFARTERDEWASRVGAKEKLIFPGIPDENKTAQIRLWNGGTATSYDPESKPLFFGCITYCSNELATHPYQIVYSGRLRIDGEWRDNAKIAIRDYRMSDPTVSHVEKP